MGVTSDNAVLPKGKELRLGGTSSAEPPGDRLVASTSTSTWRAASSSRPSHPRPPRNARRPPSHLLSPGQERPGRQQLITLAALHRTLENQEKALERMKKGIGGKKTRRATKMQDQKKHEHPDATLGELDHPQQQQQSKPRTAAMATGRRLGVDSTAGDERGASPSRDNHPLGSLVLFTLLTGNGTRRQVRCGADHKQDGGGSSDGLDVLGSSMDEVERHINNALDRIEELCQGLRA